jgi:AAA ATPase domain/Protein kinase domain
VADPQIRAVVVHEGARSRVTRVSRAGRTLMLKEPIGPDAEHRLRHETAILERLRGAAGVAQLADEPPSASMIALADAGPGTLAGLAKPVPPADLTVLSLRLALAVAELHRREVVHRDLTPANVVLAADGTPTLVDFARAAPLAETGAQSPPPSEIAGTLAYLAPEQAGRTGRPVDQRADLYALGAILYELATGEPPFATGDPLRLIHDQFARVPDPPAHVNPAVPEQLSRIIQHLLEKEPDNRYQSADGVVHDIERLRDGRTADGAASPPVGARDFPARLPPPARLVGRDAQVSTLRAALADALAGRCAGVLVSGPPGVGKTALVDDLRSAVADNDGWFVAGKFDQYRRDMEFDGANQAFRALGRLLLAEPDDELARVRARVLRAAGANAGLLAAALPEFRALLGVAPDAGDPLTAQVRAQLTGLAALRAVASRERPVVMFLDDLQWTGGTPLGFVDLLLRDEPTEGLLLVGAFRDDEVDAAHPLAVPLSHWRALATVRHLELANLTQPDLAALTS